MSSIDTISESHPIRARASEQRPVRQSVSEQEAHKRLGTSSWVILAVLGPVALFLMWRVLTLGMADLWVDSNPAHALSWRADDPAALYAAADDEFTELKFPEARALSLRDIAHYPLDGRAYRELGGVADFFGEHEKARRLFEVALRRAPRDIATRNKLIEYDLKTGRVEEAMHQIDMVLRLQPAIMSDLLPRLAAIAGNPAILPPLSKTLASRPPWRQPFLVTLADSATDPDVVDRVFASRGGDDPMLGPDGPTGLSEANLLINRQIRDGRWAAAYVNWVGTLSKTQQMLLGNIYDGSFVFRPEARKVSWLGQSGTGFDWQLPDGGTGYDILVAPRTQFAQNNVLQVRFDGLPLDYRPLRQLLVLGPGHYRLSGMGQAGAMSSEDGLHWNLACAEGERQVLAHSMAFTGDIPWGEFEVDFDVPDSDSAGKACGAQWLSLDLGAGLFEGQPLEGGAIFDDLKIVRLGATTSSPVNEQHSSHDPVTRNP